MDVLIKNMELPKDNNTLRLGIDSKGNVLENLVKVDEIGFKRFKAIELPPHGRLVNLDDVYEAINREIVPKGIFLSDFYKAFADIPIVLEAST